MQSAATDRTSVWLVVLALLLLFLDRQPTNTKQRVCILADTFIRETNEFARTKQHVRRYEKRIPFKDLNARQHTSTFLLRQVESIPPQNSK